jgi:hypothetical protein
VSTPSLGMGLDASTPTSKVGLDTSMPTHIC